MNKRLRKKKHLNEFAQYGIEVSYTSPTAVTDAHVEEFINRIDEKGLVSGGGWNLKKDGTSENHFFIELIGRDPSYIEDIRQWLLDSGCTIVSWKLMDAWYPERPLPAPSEPIS